MKPCWICGTRLETPNECHPCMVGHASPKFARCVDCGEVGPYEVCFACCARRERAAVDNGPPLTDVERALLERNAREVAYHLHWFEAEDRRLSESIEVALWLFQSPSKMLIPFAGEPVVLEPFPLPAWLAEMVTRQHAARAQLLDLHAWLTRARAALGGGA